MNLMKILGNKEAMNIIMQAIGSAMRGESPITFMKNLANTNPLFRGYDYDDLEATATKVCEENGEDINVVQTQVMDFAKSYINH